MGEGVTHILIIENKKGFSFVFWGGVNTFCFFEKKSRPKQYNQKRTENKREKKHMNTAWKYKVLIYSDNIPVTINEDSFLYFFAFLRSFLLLLFLVLSFCCCLFVLFCRTKNTGKRKTHIRTTIRSSVFCNYFLFSVFLRLFFSLFLFFPKIVEYGDGTNLQSFVRT